MWYAKYVGAPNDRGYSRWPTQYQVYLIRDTISGDQTYDIFINGNWDLNWWKDALEILPNEQQEMCRLVYG